MLNGSAHHGFHVIRTTEMRPRGFTCWTTFWTAFGERMMS
jgi:hypothetical protein